LLLLFRRMGAVFWFRRLPEAIILLPPAGPWFGTAVGVLLRTPNSEYYSSSASDPAAAAACCIAVQFRKQCLLLLESAYVISRSTITASI
jgi:hypothetical protein